MAPSRKRLRFAFSAAAIEDEQVVFDQPSLPLRFKARLFHDYHRLAILPKLARLGDGNQWITIEVDGRRYRIEMVDADEAFVLRRGWDILAAIENLHSGYKLLFQEEAPSVFAMWVGFPVNIPGAIGFSKIRAPRVPLDTLPFEAVVVSKNGPDPMLIRQTIQAVWNASGASGYIYACRVLNSPARGKFLIFSKPYTALIPKQQLSVAMRYVGSMLTIPGAIKTYGDGCARMAHEWPLYAKQWNLTLGEAFVCKIHRGPAAWEFIGCRELSETL